MTTSSSLTESVHFQNRLRALRAEYDTLVQRKNAVVGPGNGVVDRFRHSVLTEAHVPVEWRFDMDPTTNPYLMERMPVTAMSGAGALLHDGRFVLVACLEDAHNGSFFAVAESDSGVDGFRFRRQPITMPSDDEAEFSMDGMRLTRHEDGWIYGLFRVHRLVPHPDPEKGSAVVSRFGVARTHDLDTWERLPDLVSNTAAPRQVVLHPEFVDGGYALYTHPQSGSPAADGIGWALSESLGGARVDVDAALDSRTIHSKRVAGSGLGPTPIWTDYGWLHLGHGMLSAAMGQRATLQVFMTALDDPTRVIHYPAAHVLGPIEYEGSHDVAAWVSASAWIARSDGKVYIYYTSSDLRVHVAVSTLERLVDHVMQSPADAGSAAANVAARNGLIDRNRRIQGLG